ncbi:PepSY domain-containing protein [Streptomyces sp. NPDC014733]|uniref:PepSY domain-containing protein n=1 Tax=Streptomyces sp. NPDC014733 TaxID=3364885 RepID=UPI0036FDE0E5
MDTKRKDLVVRGRWRPVGPRTLGAVCAVAAAGALLAGCGSGGKSVSGAPDSPEVASPAAATSPGGSPNASPGRNLTKDQSERKELFAKTKADYEHALNAAAGAVPHSKPVSTELKGGDGGNPVWETVMATSDGTAHALRVDAVTGKAGKPVTEQQKAEDRKALATRLRDATVTAPMAAKTAMAKKSGKVAAVELENADHGKPVWKVDVVSTSDWKKTTFDVDAKDNKILKEHTDQD